MSSYLKDIILALIFLAYPLGLVLGSKHMAQFGLGKDGQRKFIHIGMGLVVLFVPLFSHLWIAIIPPILFTIFNFIDYKFGWFSEMQGEDRGNVGTILYPISYIVLMLLFYGTPYWALAVIGILTMAFGDAAASITGRAFGKSTGSYSISGENRSYAGSIAMFFVSFLIAFFVLLISGPAMGIAAGGFSELACAFLIAGLATIIEALSIKGSDNFTVPVLTAVFAWIFIAHFVPIVLGNQAIVNQPLY